MSTVTTRWWVDGETAWVAVFGIGQGPPMDHFFMDYERHGDEWRRTYPAGTPHLERAMDNFAKYLELMLRQFTGRDPVPWRDALSDLPPH